MMSLDDVASTSFGGRNQTLASPRGASLLDNMRQPVSGYSFHDESVAQAAAIAAAEMRSSGGNLMLGSYDGASSFLGARNRFQGRHSPPFGGGGVPRRLSAPGARAHRPSPPAEFAPFAALIDQADDMPGFEFEMENSLGTTPTPNVGRDPPARRGAAPEKAGVHRRPSAGGGAAGLLLLLDRRRRRRSRRPASTAAARRRST